MALSPMMKHYLEVKQKYHDCIVFYRLGDFYEMFYDDAVKASRLLDLTLTGRDCGLEERAPMCGVPYHAADGYIAKLVAAGEKVAICEQLSDPKEGKGMVERDVIRIVSAGTLIEEGLLDAKRSNFIACAVKQGGLCALAWADITTGECAASEAESVEKLLAMLINLSVAEVICNDEMLIASQDSEEVQRGLLPHFSCPLPQTFSAPEAERALRQQFGAASMQALGIEGLSALISAAGALIAYLHDTQKHALKNINRLRVSNSSKYMVLDPTAVRNLELVRSNAEGKKYGSLLWLLDRTKTGMGARKLASLLLMPLQNREEIDERLNAVDELYRATVVRMGIMDMLSGMRDIERLTGRISNGNLQPRDCIALSHSLAIVPSLRLQLAGFSSPLMRRILSLLADTKEVCSLIDRAIDERAGLLRDGGFIRAGYCKELDDLRGIKDKGKTLLAELEAREREETGIRTLRVGYNRVFGYYIEVSNSFKEKVPYTYVRRQTLSTGERYVTEELKALEEKILGSDDRAQRLENSLYAELMEILGRNISVLQTIADAIARLDCLVSLATVAKENKYCRPTMVEEGALEYRDGRHPVVEALSRERFVPNDCLLDGADSRTMIITGPNMAGKSTFLRQTALIVLMAHIGSFVPAASATVPLCDRIFTRIGASDNLILDKSTFMVEMTEVAAILRNATRRSLLILDEVGRGTSTYDGLSIAWAVIEHLNENVRAKTLFATHYHELTELEGGLPGVKNYRINARESAGTIVFLRKIVRGGASRSFGIEVASLAGVPQEVTARAKRILRTLESKGAALPPQQPCEQEDALREELRALDVNALSPIEALNVLAEWKEKYREN